MIPKRFLLVTSTFSLSVLLYVDRACISTAKDPIVRDLGLSDQQWGAVMAAFAFGYALLQTPAGALADRLGARRILTAVVAFWSLFTGLTAAAWNFVSLAVVRFLFGAGEAGAFPGMAGVVYSWIPVKERGLVKGLNFSGSRLGAAITMPILPWMIAGLGWKQSFLVLMTIGFGWSVFWWFWFRDEPTEHPGLSKAELEHILANRQQRTEGGAARALPVRAMLRSSNMWLVMAQYFASNFTFFFTLTWLYPHVKRTYDLDAVAAGFYAMVPLLGGAVGNVFSGWLVDRLYRQGRGGLSRRGPAILGFLLASAGLMMSVGQETPAGAIAWLTVAIFGADMTLSPSWSFCIDIGGRHAGAVSGTMNMAGNLGSALVGLAFPFLVARFGPEGFFRVGALLNVLAIGAWLLISPSRKLEDPT
jgi:ACS family glucarate transporter-like MFS transporter